MKNIIKYAFYPVILIGTIWASFSLIQWFPEAYLILLPIAILLPLLIVFVYLENLMPYNLDWNKNRNDFKTDLLQTFITLPLAAQLTQFLLPFLVFFPITWLANTSVSNYLEGELHPLLAFSIALLLCEFCYYWMHRMSHSVSQLWKLHAVHHSSKRVYWANSGRFHFFDAILGSAAYLLPLLLLNASDNLIILVLVFSGVTGFLEHVNINFKAGFLNYIFNSAELHRWHHSEIEKESNHNFGKVLIIWDLLFGTYLLPKDRSIEQVGIEGEDDPVGFKNQFLHPFKGE